MRRPTNKRLGLTQVRAWHRSIDQARAITADGGLPVNIILCYWGRIAWRSLRPCVLAPRRTRWQRQWETGSPRRFAR